MKKNMLLLGSMLLAGSLIAQTNCDAIKKENDYLKKALSLNTPITEQQNGDLTFSITKIEGNSKAQSVTIELLIKNKGRNLDNFTSQVKSVIDINGTEYLLAKAFIGAQDATHFGSADLFRDTPLKCKYTFNGIQPEVKVIKLFDYPVQYHVPGTNSFDFQKENVEFKDLNIQWK
jgi:hypothetical protein